MFIIVNMKAKNWGAVAVRPIPKYTMIDTRNAERLSKGISMMTFDK